MIAISFSGKGKNLLLGLACGIAIIVLTLFGYGCLALLFADPLVAVVIPLLILQTLIIYAASPHFKRASIGKVVLVSILTALAFGQSASIYLLDPNHLLQKPKDSDVSRGNEEMVEGSIDRHLLPLAGCAYEFRASSPQGQFPDSLDSFFHTSATCNAAFQYFKDNEPDLRLTFRKTREGFELRCDRLWGKNFAITQDGITMTTDTVNGHTQRVPYRSVAMGAETVRGIIDCISKNRNLNGKGFPDPTALSQMCEILRRLEQYRNNIDRISYSPKCGNAGRCTSFELQVRPVHYGPDGIRSFYVREDLVIHATGENREATASDPQVPEGSR